MDFNGVGRTNYFRVKDKDAFKKWVELCGLKLIEKGGRVGLVTDNGYPDSRHDPADPDVERVDFNFFDELRAHLPAGEVAIYMDTGNEGHRYCAGFAVALMAGKSDVCINIDDIYDLAAKKFRVARKRISGCSY